MHAVVDLDTGKIGYVEIKGEVYSEFDYISAPKEWKVALLNKLEPLLAKKQLTNLRITRNS